MSSIAIIIARLAETSDECIYDICAAHSISSRSRKGVMMYVFQDASELYVREGVIL